MKIVDRLEEFLIAFLMGAAPLLIFVVVVHRYAAGIPIPDLQDLLLRVDLSWAQELCIYMFVWMAKFGAAYGVRTGIHIGVDVLINRLPPRPRRFYILLGFLMCFRFLQVASSFAKTGALPHHDESRVEGIEAEDAVLLPQGLHPAPPDKERP